jgi:hypothetical protein
MSAVAANPDPFAVRAAVGNPDLPPNPPAPPSKTFHWSVTANAASDQWKHKMQGYGWKTLKIVAMVAFAFFACAACVAVGLYAPLYVPFVAIGVVLCLEMINRIMNWTEANAQACFLKSAEEEAVIEKSAACKSMDPAQIDNLFFKEGISIPQLKLEETISDGQQLIPVLARYEFWKNKHVAFLKLEDDLKNDPAIKREVIIKNRKDAFKAKENSYQARVSAAFYLAVLKNPTLQCDLKEICGFYRPKFALRQLDKLYEKDEVLQDLFIIFHREEKKPIGIAELEKLDYSPLADRLLDAIPEAKTDK